MNKKQKINQLRGNSENSRKPDNNSNTHPKNKSKKRTHQTKNKPSYGGSLVSIPQHLGSNASLSSSNLSRKGAFHVEFKTVNQSATEVRENREMQGSVFNSQTLFSIKVNINPAVCLCS